MLLAIAGIGYAFDTFTALLGTPTNVGAFTFMGEFLLGLWLLIRGRRITLSNTASQGRHHRIAGRAASDAS